MADTLISKIEVLREASLSALRNACREHFPSKKAVSSNRTYLWRRIAHKMQELEQGGLSPDALKRLQLLMTDYDPVNNWALKSQAVYASSGPRRDRRLPLPGTLITKQYKGTTIQVKVLEKGFEYDGKVYKSLTAIAKEITGAHWNGYLFFDL